MEPTKDILTATLPVIQNHKTGLKANWKAEGHTLTDQQKTELKAQAAQTRLEREKAIKEQYTNAAALSKEKWDGIIKSANKQHPYLSKKGVLGYGLKEDKFGNLVIPGKDTEGNIRTLQTISPSGKFFEKNAQKAGTFHIIDPENKLKNGSPILIAEGYATAASVHMATGYPVASAFDASNLEPVAKALHEKYPQSKIMLMADNDYHLMENVGVKKAEAAAKGVDGIVLIPKFSEQERSQKLTDFNDLHKSRGLDAVKEQLSGILKTTKKNIQNKSLASAMAM
ncbi:toprim domain-containing protein [Desulfovibrio gilichinskyi]|uniref:toprim domain-containing protein n=1 Tax=Desulfovibrio gilichinskyi TaxID=1519643 RepID=UPI001FE81050|nr:toprim domain-containing protein [Desulfovibrio gilichinskyi]